MTYEKINQLSYSDFSRAFEKRRCQVCKRYLRSFVLKKTPNGRLISYHCKYCDLTYYELRVNIRERRNQK